MSTSRKTLGILTPRQRWRMLILLGLMLIGMVMETIGIGLVIPIVSLLSGEASSAALPGWAARISALAGREQSNAAVWGILGLVAVFAIKAAFLAFLSWRQADFVTSTRAEISQRMLAGYMHQDYAFHLGRNSAQLMRNILKEVNQFATGTINSSLVLTTEALVAIGIGVLLIAVEPVGALVVICILGLASASFVALTRSRLLRWGKRRQRHDRYRIQHLQQALGGVKDAKLLGREQEFLDQYSLHDTGTAFVAKRMIFLNAIPRLWLELLAVVGLALLVLTMEAQGRPASAFIPTVGLFAAAAFRILPSANRLLGAIQSLRFSLPSVTVLHAELIQFRRSASNEASDAIKLTRTLELKEVTYAYPDGTQAIEKVSLTIPKGAATGFIGASGAGKSTLIDVIMGLLTPTGGSILIDGQDVQKNLRSWQDQIGYVPQTIFLTDDTLRRNVAFGLPPDRIDDGAVYAALRAARLDEFVATLPEGVETLVGERGVRLSGGQRQRIGIARALYHDPPVLVLDEATSALDTATEQGVMEAVAALRGKTILIIAHRLSTVAQCDTIVRLENGRVTEHAPATVMLPERHSAVS